MTTVLCARLRPSNQNGAAGSVKELERIVGQIRARWPKTRIVIRGNSGFCRDTIMSWRETNCVKYVLGLARNTRRSARHGRRIGYLNHDETGKNRDVTIIGERSGIG